MHRMLFIGLFEPLAKQVKLMGCCLFMLAAAAPDAAIVSARLRAPVIQEGASGYVEVAFDRQVCLPSNESPPQVLNGPVTRVVQVRRDAMRISLVVVAQSAADATVCDAADTVAFALPKLSAGTYTVRVAEAKYRFAPTLYATFQIATAVAGDSVLTVTPVATPTAVYVVQRDFGTSLVIRDEGTYQVWPTFASEYVAWQPVFYAWPAGAAGTAPGLKAVEWLAVDRGPRLGQAFYTIDPAEKAALLRDGYFKAQQPTFAAFAPEGGVCADGHTGIYRAFDPKALIHRFVPVATYRTFVANGWIGEGIAFCAASELNGQSEWAPN